MEKLGLVFILLVLILPTVSHAEDDVGVVRISLRSEPTLCLGGSGKDYRVGHWSCSADTHRYDWKIVPVSSDPYENRFFLKNRANDRCMRYNTNGGLSYYPDCNERDYVTIKHLNRDSEYELRDLTSNPNWIEDNEAEYIAFYHLYRGEYIQYWITSSLSDPLYKLERRDSNSTCLASESQSTDASDEEESSSVSSPSAPTSCTVQGPYGPIKIC